jgi:uncharacterized protein
MSEEAELRERMMRDLQDIERMCMPFGKHGPAAHPPEGCPLFDLPAEYLAWFEKSAGGWPRGRLGELMRVVYQMKVDGSDRVAFDPMRKRRGGRTVLREKRGGKSYEF